MDENLFQPTNPGEDGNPPAPPLETSEPGKSVQNQPIENSGIFKSVDLQFQPQANAPVNTDVVQDISDIFNNPPAVNPQDPNINQPNKADSKADVDVQEKLDKTDKAYRESSAEAIRLATEQKAYAPFIPLLEKMRKDPDLVRYVDDYLKGGGMPKNVLEQLGLPEDFKYNTDEMIDGKSDSFRVLSKIIDNALATRFDAFAKQNNINFQRMNDESRFRTEMKMTEDDWKDYSTFANDKIKNFSYEDMFYLWKREDREKQLIANAQTDTMQQMQRANNIAFPQGTGIVPMPDTANKEFDWYKSIFGDPLAQQQDDIAIMNT
jgi:hypothetical protein